MFSAFCIAPWLDFEKMELKWQRLNKIYAIIFLFVIVGILSISTVFKPSTTKDIEVILYKLNIIIYIFFVSLVILSSIFFKQDKFVSYLNRMNELEIKMATQNRDNFYLYFIFGHAGFAASTVYLLYWWSKERCTCYLGVMDCLSVLIPEYYCFIGTLGACRVIWYLKCKFVELDNLLESQVKSFNENTNQYSQKLLLRHISHIRKYYRNIFLMLNEFSQMYGGVIALMTWHTIVQTLRYINLWVLNVNRHKENLYDLPIAVMTAWALVSYHVFLDVPFHLT